MSRISESVESLVLRQKNFIMSSPKAANRRISFIKDGLENDSEFDSWAVSDESSPKLLLIKEGKIISKLTYSYGKWEGRDIRGGTTVVFPFNKKEWDDLFSVKRVKGGNENLLDPLTNLVDWSRYDYKLSDMFQRENESAIIIIGCNRPGYYNQVIDSISANNTKKYDIYCFVDNPIEDREKIYFRQVCDLSKKITDRVIIRPINFGCGRNIIDARNQVFSMGYESAFVFEDDLIISDNYIRFCERLLKWGQDNYDNIGAVQGWSKCLMPADEKINHLGEVHSTYTNWWGYLITRYCWDRIKKFILEYQDKYLITQYSNRPVRTILESFRPYAEANFVTSASGFLPDQISIDNRRRLFNSIPSGQDGATWIAFDKEGFVRLAPTVNRSRYIGKEGIHMNPEQFRRDRFDRITLEKYPESKVKFYPRGFKNDPRSSA